MSQSIRIVALLGMVSIALPQGSLAQEPTPVPTPLILSLSDCIRRSLANSPGLEAAEFDREVVEGKLKEAKRAYYLPEAKLRMFGGPVPDVPPGYGPDAGFPNTSTDIWDMGPFFQVRIEAIQPLFTFGKLKSLEEAASKGVKAKKEQETAVRNELIRRVKGAYVGLTYLYSLKDFLEELMDRAGKAREKVTEQLTKREAAVTEIDRMRLDVFLGETDRRLIELRSGIELGLSAIRILTAIPASVPIDIADKNIRFQNVDLKTVDHYLNRAMAVRPEVQQLTHAVGVKKALLKASGSDFFPMFFVGGFYHYGFAPDRQDVKNPYLVDDFNLNSGGVALGLEQKLGFHLTDAKVSQAKSDYEQALAQQRLAMQGIEMQVKEAYYTALAKRDGVQSAESSFKAGRSWLMATTLNWGVGLTPTKDLLEAFVAYSKVKAGYLDVIHDYQKALADLALKVGEEVTDLAY